jgi:type II secretory pathway pseudopilin PulG
MIRNWLKRGQEGQTLIELLVAIGLFATVSLLALQVFVNVTRIQGRIALENAIYEDSRFMMERITRAIRNNAIDYDEYFNKGLDSANQYGDLYGCYAAQFYNPGTGKPVTPKDPSHLNDTPGMLGALCNDDAAYQGQDNCVVYKPSVDLNTGVFPYTGYPNNTTTKDSSNAFCPKIYNGACTVNSAQQSVQELYLIDKDGKIKSIFAKKKIKNFGSGKDEYALGFLKLAGKDSNNDGITEQWRNCGGAKTFCCASGFDCKDSDKVGTLENTLDGVANGIYTGFVPISPLRSNVADLRFTISPTEDPRKAFAEGQSVVAQPEVNIVLTVRPSQDQLNKYGNFDISDIPTITLQTTVSTRIQSEVRNYLGSDTYKIGNGYTPAVTYTANHLDGGHCPLPQSL